MKSKDLMKMNIQHFAGIIPHEGTGAMFDPDNVMLMDMKDGMVPTEQGSLVLKQFVAESALAQLATVMPMTKPKVTFTYLADGPGAYWVSEAEKIQTSKATWLTAEMEAKKIAVILPVSKEFLKYSVSDFFAQMQPAIAEAFLTKFDQAGLFGEDSPYKVGQSVWEKIVASGNTIVKGSGKNLYDEFNSLLALVEDGDNDPNGFTTTKRFRKDLRGTVDNQGLPIFNDVQAGATSSALGLPIGYASGKAWNHAKAEVIVGDWDNARYGILEGITYSISEDATLSTVVGEDGKPINLFERDLVALKATMYIGFMTLKDDAFSALTPTV